MGWDGLWALTLKRFGAETIEVRILIGLGIAFLILLIIEGLRASFRPARSRTALIAPAPTVLAAPPTELAPQLLRVRHPIFRATPKRAKRSINPHRPPLPKIRRTISGAKTSRPHFTEEAAPYSPLSPNH